MNNSLERVSCSQYWCAIWMRFGIVVVVLLLMYISILWDAEFFRFALHSEEWIYATVIWIFVGIIAWLWSIIPLSIGRMRDVTASTFWQKFPWFFYGLLICLNVIALIFLIYIIQSEDDALVFWFILWLGVLPFLLIMLAIMLLGIIIIGVIPSRNAALSVHENSTEHNTIHLQK